MGGWVSNLMNKQEDGEEERLRRYEEKIASDGTFGYSDDLDKKKVRWWEWLVFHKRIRVLYVLILAVLLGIFIPLIIFIKKLGVDDRTIYGSCLINHNARFECLINSKKIVDENACMDALCCWENSNSLPFKCYHSFPTAYQYKVEGIQVKDVGGTEWTTIDASANQDEKKMSALQILTHWESDGHLVVEFYNPSKFPNRGRNVKDSSSRQAQNSSASPKQGNGNRPLSIMWGDENKYFYIRVTRSDSGETIFDTRLGPVIAANDYFALSTVLPTGYFLGLRGGQRSILASQTFALVNGFENNEFPFYISHEATGLWHGVLIDSTEPMLTQVVQAPGIMFYLEASRPEMNLHFFAGPTQADILRQLHQYLRTKHGNIEPMIPPYWGLGLHMCRQVENGSVALEHIQELVEKSNIPFDSDCIEEYLRHPVDIDMERFPNEILSEIQLLLETKSKRIVLSQKVTQPENEDTPSLADVWLMDSSDRSKPFKGQTDDRMVKYIDVFSSKLTEFPPTIPDIKHHGISLSDSFPKLDNPSGICKNPTTRLETEFTSPVSTTGSLNSSYFWGSVCPDVLHKIGNAYTSHYHLHNSYGHQSLKTVSNTLSNQFPQNDYLLTSSSYWTGSMYYGGFNGLQVPFTWRGLQDSVAYIVRNYALSPIASTPICGTMIFNLTIPFSNELCLRWFQLGLLLPIARNSYDGNSTYGAIHFSDLYKGYLNEAILARYTYAPYYYTLLLNYQISATPMITPMSFYFNHESNDDNTLLSKLDQFMIGEAILAAPIIDRGLTRLVYFPGGTWYTMAGEKVSERNEPSIQQSSGHITETPMFLRAGHIIPTLQQDKERIGTTIEESLGGNFTLLVALSSSDPASSTGNLTIRLGQQYHSLYFRADLVDSKLSLRIESLNTCHKSGVIEPSAVAVNPVIDQIRVFGYPQINPLEVSVEPPPETSDGIQYTNYDFLRVFHLNINWCLSKTYEIIVRKRVAP